MVAASLSSAPACLRHQLPDKRSDSHPGLLASNHLSYLDILVLGAASPCVFVAKYDVRIGPSLAGSPDWQGPCSSAGINGAMSCVRVEKSPSS